MVYPFYQLDKNMKKYTTLFAVSTLVLPFVASAQLTRTEDLILAVMNIVDFLIILVAAISLLAFMWGLAKFIFKVGGDEGAIEEGKNLMKWGLIALFVMLSVWGIIRFFQGELGLTENSPIDITNLI